MGGQAGSGGGGGEGEASSAAASEISSAVSSGSVSSVSATSEESAATSAGSITASSAESAAPTMMASTSTDATGGVTVYMTSISTVTAPGTCAPQATDSLVPGTTIPDGYTSPQIEYPLVANSSYYHQNTKWDDAHQRARDYLSGWTVEEKSQLCTGTGWSFGRCVGNIPPIPSQNFSGLCLQDSPLGVRFADRVSAFPAGVNSGSTFDKDLMYARGYAMGSEYKAKGVNIALGPAIDIGRNAAGGRNWESFGADPYLMGWGAEMTIRGMQDAGVQAT
jgi:beta-glucosidase